MVANYETIVAIYVALANQEYGKMFDLIAVGFYNTVTDWNEKLLAVYHLMMDDGRWKTIFISLAMVGIIAILISLRGKKTSLKERVATIALGHTFNQLFDWAFNYPLYMLVIGYLGLGWGYVTMAGISFLTCLVFIRFYDWLKIDWLGIEVAKEAKDFGPSWIKNIQAKSLVGKILWWPFSKIILLILWAINKGGFVAFMVLSMYTDPFMVTVYMRKGWGEYNGLSRKDWYVFLASTVVSNAYWAIRTFAILEIAKYSWKLIFS